jgi:hypothetical protein
MGISPGGTETKNNCVGEGQQQITALQWTRTRTQSELLDQEIWSMVPWGLLVKEYATDNKTEIVQTKTGHEPYRMLDTLILTQPHSLRP